MLDKKRICIIRRAYYPQESHVRRNAETLVNAGFDVYLVCLKKAGEKRFENINGVNTYRIPLSAKRKGIASYLMEYICFFLMSFVYVSILHLNYKFDFVEADSMPDFLVFCGLIPKITGAKLVLYLFESMPEMWAQKQNLLMNHWMIKLMKFHEKLSCLFADKVICCHAMAKDAVVLNGISPDKISVVLNVPDERVFNDQICDNYSKTNANLELIQHGTITENYGIQIVLRALAKLKGKYQIHYNIVGDGEYRPFLEKMARDLGIADLVTFHGFVDWDELIRLLCEFDVGIIPMLFEYQSPNKLFDLLALKKPVIASDLKTFKQHFSSKAVKYFAKGDADSLALSIEYFLKSDANKIKAQIECAYDEYANYRWDVMKEVYLKVYAIDGLA